MNIDKTKQLLKELNITLKDNTISQLHEALKHNNIFKIAAMTKKHPDRGRVIEMLQKPRNFLDEQYKLINDILEKNKKTILYVLQFGHMVNIELKKFSNDDFTKSIAGDNTLSYGELNCLSDFFRHILESYTFDVKTLICEKEKRPVKCNLNCCVNYSDKNLAFFLYVSNYSPSEINYIKFVASNEKEYCIPETKEIDNILKSFENSLKNISDLGLILNSNKQKYVKELARYCGIQNSILLGEIIYPKNYHVTVVLKEKIIVASESYRKTMDTAIKILLKEIFDDSGLENITANISCCDYGDKYSIHMDLRDNM